MPRQNRVTPFSTLIDTPARGTLTGNRGCLHDEHGQIRRSYLGQRWIICLLEFKGRQRAIMQPGHYTELFFLDEATALAAGHRPCAECQRDRFNLFREFWAKGNPGLAGAARPPAATIDAALHPERTAAGVDQSRFPTSLDELPDGTFITNDEQTAAGVDQPRFPTSLDELPDGTFITNDEQTAYLVLSGQLLRWSPAGYENPAVQAIHNPVRVLTPPSIVRALAAGYPVKIHTSARQVFAQFEKKYKFLT